MRTTQAPCDHVESGMLTPPHVPAAGNACRTRSSGVRRSTSATFHAWGTQFSCEIIAPLGNDVVPDVYSSVKTSSAVGAGP
ncbi:MAG: hypothetical protein AUI49_08070 [Candidatus Rokubacteria bacterium 13_1_40CM_2_68_13]|nr:MAG: hypothetical protein AUI49_08070 [Candidatus Rokubacteria bacterium 13_1_40CM_2_68_13]